MIKYKIEKETTNKPIITKHWLLTKQTKEEIKEKIKEEIKRLKIEEELSNEELLKEIEKVAKSEIEKIIDESNLKIKPKLQEKLLKLI